VAFLIIGFDIKAVTHIPLPANVIGMVLLFIALRTGLVKMEWCEKASHFLLRHMMLFFIPSVVGAAFLASELTGQWDAAIVALIVSTLCGLAVTGWTANRLLPAVVDEAEQHPDLRESLVDVGRVP